MNINKFIEKASQTNIYLHYHIQSQLYTPVEPPRFVPNEKLCNALRKAILDHTGGVRVLYAPPKTGKTSAIRHTILEFQQSKQRGAVIIDDWVPGYNEEKGFLLMLKQRLGASQANQWTSINDIFKPLQKKTILVLDQFDQVYNNTPKLESLIVGLAEQSVLSKKFVVILSVREQIIYETILSWNEGQKITSV